jgi:hypothetical protein
MSIRSAPCCCRRCYLTSSGFLFGYAKPVPVNFGRFNHPRRDIGAGGAGRAGTNVLLANHLGAVVTLVDLRPRSVCNWLAPNLRNRSRSTSSCASSTCCRFRRSTAAASRSALLPRFLASHSRGSSLWHADLMLLFIVPIPGRQGTRLRPVRLADRRPARRCDPSSCWP